MFRRGLPLGCLFLAAAAVVGILTMRWLTGTALRAGVGVTALLLYAAVMCVHYFETSSQPGGIDRPRRACGPGDSS